MYLLELMMNTKLRGKKLRVSVYDRMNKDTARVAGEDVEVRHQRRTGLQRVILKKDKIYYSGCFERNTRPDEPLGLAKNFYLSNIMFRRYTANFHQRGELRRGSSAVSVRDECITDCETVARAASQHQEAVADPRSNTRAVLAA